MRIVLKQNVINIVAGAICIAIYPVFIILVWITNATLGERLMVTLLCGALTAFTVLELLKAIFWRIVVQDDSFAFRNRWGKETSYSYSDICEISIKSRYYLVHLADQSIMVEYRSVSNCMYFVDVAARNGVKTVEKA